MIKVQKSRELIQNFVKTLRDYMEKASKAENEWKVEKDEEKKKEKKREMKE